MRPLYRAGQRDTCTVRSQPVYKLTIADSINTFGSVYTDNFPHATLPDD